MLKKLRCTMDLSGQFFLIKKAEDNDARRKYHNYIRCYSGKTMPKTKDLPRIAEVFGVSLLDLLEALAASRQV